MGKSTINVVFSIAMLNYQRVVKYYNLPRSEEFSRKNLGPNMPNAEF